MREKKTIEIHFQLTVENNTMIDSPDNSTVSCEDSFETFFNCYFRGEFLSILEVILFFAIAYFLYKLHGR